MNMSRRRPTPSPWARNSLRVHTIWTLRSTVHNYSHVTRPMQRLRGVVVVSDMGQKRRPPKMEDDEVERLIQLAADRRLALMDVRTMESKIMTRFHLLEQSPTRQ